MSAVAAEPAPATPTDRRPLPRAFWFLAAGMLVNRLGTFVLPYLALYLTLARGFDAGTAGIVVAAYGAGAIVASLVGGELADRWGRLATMLTGLSAAAVLTALLAVVRTAPAIVLVAIALGLVSELYRPAASATVADLVPEPDRVRAFGLLYWAGNLGFTASALLGGLLASRSFTALFLIDALTSAACGVVLWWGLRAVRHRIGETRTPGLAATGLGRVLRDPVFMPFVALAVVFMSIYFQATVAVPVTATANGIGPARYGVIIAANGITVLALQPPLTWVLERLRPGPAMAASALALGVGFGMLAWIHSYYLFIVAVVIWTMGEIGYSVTGPALVARLAPDHLQGRYQGVFGISSGVAAFAGPAVGGFLLARLGPSWLWLLCLAAGAGMAAGHLALGRGYRRPAAPAEEPTKH